MSDVSPYVWFLKQALKHWPSVKEEASDKNFDKNVKNISGFISKNFDPAELVVAIKGFKCVVEITPTDDNSVVIIFLDKEDCPYKAIINRNSDRFFLESIKFECPACFGDGVLEERNKNIECYICGGAGWGVA